MTALIFGASGQDGHYLRAELERAGHEVVGVSRSGSPETGDVRRLEDVERLIRERRPARIFHLAANSTTRHDALFENHETISTGTLNVLESAKRHVPEARVFVTGSGVQFRNDGTPISETTPFEATSPYGIARIQSVYAARYYRRLGLATYVGYLFHHESPLRKPGHVSKLVADAVREGRDLELGDVSVVKEWTFAGDVARGILTLVEQDEIHEAAIGSGEAHSIEEWLEACFSLVGKSWPDHVRVRDGFVPEYPRLVSDPARIRSLGWSPRVGFGELAEMMVRGD